MKCCRMTECRINEGLLDWGKGRVNGLDAVGGHDHSIAKKRHPLSWAQISEG